MTSDLVVELLQTLDAPQARYCELERYYTGTQPLAFLAPEARAALGNRLGRMASNLPRLAVTALSDRLRITGWSGADAAGIFQDWLRNDLDQLSSVAHRESLLFGKAFVIVWAGADGRPQITVESAKQVSVIRYPATREVTSAVKRWRTKTETHAVDYLPDRIERWKANTPGAATAGFELVETIDNPIGVVPVVPIINADRLLDDGGASEIDDLAPLCDALNKVLADLMVSSEYTAISKRFASGISPVEQGVVDADGDPVLDENGQPVVELVSPLSDDRLRVWITENPDAKFGQLDAGPLAGYESAVRILLTQIQAVSALPSAMLGVMADQPTSADALRAAESSLTARAEARQQTFGKAWDQVGKLIVAVRDGVDAADVDVRVVWCDPSTSSEAQSVDAAVKLFQAGNLSRSGTLARLGMSADQIAAELDNTRTDAQLGADVRLGRYVAHLTDQLAAPTPNAAPRANETAIRAISGPFTKPID